jgi:hypothetical protein
VPASFPGTPDLTNTFASLFMQLPPSAQLQISDMPEYLSQNATAPASTKSDGGLGGMSEHSILALKGVPKACIHQIGVERT